MTSQTTCSGQINAPAITVMSSQGRLLTSAGNCSSAAESSLPKVSLSHVPDPQVDMKETSSPEGREVGPTGKPPGPKSKKKSIRRSASSDAILSNYVVGGSCNTVPQSVIKLPTTPRFYKDFPIAAGPSSASPGATTKSHLNLWPLGSLFKKRLAVTNRTGFKKLSQGSTEGLNQELEKLTLTSEDVQQRLQIVPDGHRAPIQELLDMFCDSPPIAGSSSGDSGTPSHLPLIPTLSSSSSASPPPAIASTSGDPSSAPAPRHQHQKHRSYEPRVSWSPRDSPEASVGFNLGSEVRQVRPLRNSILKCSLESSGETSQPRSKEEKHPTSRPARDSPPLHSSSSLLPYPSLPRLLLSPVAVRANIPSNDSAFASYPTLPKSFKVKDSLCHGNRSAEGLVAAAAGVGNG